MVTRHLEPAPPPPPPAYHLAKPGRSDVFFRFLNSQEEIEI